MEFEPKRQYHTTKGCVSKRQSYNCGRSVCVRACRVFSVCVGGEGAGWGVGGAGVRAICACAQSCVRACVCVCVNVITLC